MALKTIFLVLATEFLLCQAYYGSEYDMYQPYGDIMARYRRLRQIPARNAEEEAWPTGDSSLENSGQVSGVDTDSDGNIHVLRRLDHSWTPRAFSNYMQYRKIDEGPISQDAVVVLSPKGEKIRSWGNDLFYMPHGITVDRERNTWITDVALHQVLKFPRGSNTPSLTLGEKFRPGRGPYSFCMPTDVAIDSKGNIYVSDGYCNSRILMFRSNKDFVRQWGSGDNRMLNIPHSLTIIRRAGGEVLCVADRENERIICYQGMNNDVKWAVRKIPTSSKIYAIDTIGNTLVGAMFDGKKSTGFNFNTIRWEFTGKWNFSKGALIHDIACEEKSTMYAANINLGATMKPVYKINLEPRSQI